MWLTGASRRDFPSGHATTFAMAAGLLVLALSTHPARRPRRATGPVLCWAATVGIGRVCLGAHWASDVVAGRLLALLRTAWGARLLRRLTSPARTCSPSGTPPAETSHP
ncbi:phosphatase PAP2 family protein [Streptomyces termitum]